MVSLHECCFSVPGTRVRLEVQGKGARSFWDRLNSRCPWDIRPLLTALWAPDQGPGAEFETSGQLHAELIESELRCAVEKPWAEKDQRRSCKGGNPMLQEGCGQRCGMLLGARYGEARRASKRQSKRRTFESRGGSSFHGGRG